MNLSLHEFLKNLELAFWEKRRSSVAPSIFQHDYLHHVALYKKIKESFALIRRRSKKSTFDIVDVGCGNKPYLDVFKPYTQKYVGVDVDPKAADIIAAGEKLPFKNASFDLVLCFQTLEHCSEPEQVIAQMLRVLRRGGWVILSTHGAWMYHPCPHDYYRWTNEGLSKLFRNFSSSSATPMSRWPTSIIQLVNIELYGIACRHVGLKLFLYGVIAGLNIVGKALASYGLANFTTNYVVVARK